MSKVCSFCLLAGAALLCAHGGEGEPADDFIRVATFNVYNYLAMDRRVEGRFRPAYPKPEREKEGIRRAIQAVAPHVLALQELGPAPYLEELRQDLAHEGLVFPHSYLLEAADPDRHVGVLARIPVREFRPHPEIEFRYFGDLELVKRGLLEVRFGDGKRAWSLFIVHLKSRYTDRPDDPMSETRRTLEARAVRDLILRRQSNPDTECFIIGGDFNDTTGSRTLAAFLARGERTIAGLLPTRDSRGETWTHRYLPEDTYTRVDFLLVSPAALDGIRGGGATIYDGPFALVGTDHRLVYLDFRPVPCPAGTASAFDVRGEASFSGVRSP